MPPHFLTILLLVALLASVTVETKAKDARPIRVLVWDEQQPEQKQAYGEKFLGETIAAHLSSLPGIVATNSNLEAPEQGLDDARLDAADVVIWWAHKKSHAVTNANAEKVAARVRAGKLSLIALHSAHWAKPFIRLMQDRAKTDALEKVPAEKRDGAKWEYALENPIGKVPKRDAPVTPFLQEDLANNVWKLTLPACVFPAWRADAAPSHVHTLLPQHPIAAGLPALWDIPQTEMYDEPFHVPPPDAVIFEERWDKGERFRSGSLWKIGEGHVFYFRPGHETYPIYRQAEPLRVIENAVRWMGATTRAK